MATIKLTHASRHGNNSDLEHPEGMLVAVVLLGALGLAWFALYVWLFLSRGAWLP
jgi:hypothetical protein